MELQCDLSRDAYGGRKHYDDAEGRETSGIKMMYGKSFRNRGNGDASKPHNREILEKDANVEEPIKGAHAEGFPSSQGSKMKNPLHRHPKSCTKNFKENEPQQKREVGCSKAALDATDVGGRMRRHKQQNSEQNHGSSLKLPQEIASQHNQQQSSLNQSVIRQSQRRVPKSISEKGKVEQCPRTLKRKHDSETSPPPNLLTGKGMKRSRRVAQRLAQEEPPPPPLKLPRLHLVLTRKEIQEDWIKITGHKYTGKPRKSTLVQKGLGLCTALTCPSSIEYLTEPHCAFD